MSAAAVTTQIERKHRWAPNAGSARRAAEQARHAASVARDWAERAGAGRLEAAEATRAAERATEAAARSRAATSEEDMRRHAIEAIDAAERAIEADRLTSAAIAASMWAVEDRRQGDALHPAA